MDQLTDAICNNIWIHADSTTYARDPGAYVAEYAHGQGITLNQMQAEYVVGQVSAWMAWRYA